MGNPFSKAIDPAEEEKKEQERMRKARESMFVNKNPIMQQPSIPKTEEKQRPTSQVNTNQNINSQTSKTQVKEEKVEKVEKVSSENNISEVTKQPEEKTKPVTNTITQTKIIIDEVNKETMDLKKACSTLSQESDFSKNK